MTATKPDYLTIDAYENARDLPEAVRLNRAFIDAERQFTRGELLAADEYPDPDRTRRRLGYMMAMLTDFEAALGRAERIWREEMAATLPRIAQRIRDEVPNQEDYGDMAGCVESGDYASMAR